MDLREKKGGVAHACVAPDCRGGVGDLLSARQVEAVGVLLVHVPGDGVGDQDDQDQALCQVSQMPQINGSALPDDPWRDVWSDGISWHDLLILLHS